MPNGLDRWLNQATRCLSNDSTARVVTEIREHYECSRDAAIGDGAGADQADEVALTALGDARRANRQYRKVLLTSSEARLLREGNWEARAICSRPLVKWLVLSMPAMAILAAIELFHTGATEAARVLLRAGIAFGVLFTPPFLPVYTPARSRMVRYLKWVVLAGLPFVAFGADALKYSWLIASLWPVAWVEWTRIAIRRKLPIGQWPKHLYL
jgi:hypothetical protein